MAGSAHGWNYAGGASADREGGWRAVSGANNQNVFLNLGRGGQVRELNLQAYAARSRTQTAGSLPESIFDIAPRSNFTAGDLEKLNLVQLAVSGATPMAAGRGGITVYARASHADRFNANQRPDDNVRGLTGAVSEGVNADWRRSFEISNHELDARAGVDASADQVRVRMFDVPPIGTAPLDSLATDVSSPRVSAAGYLLADLHVGRVTLSGGTRYDDIHTPFTDRLHADDSTGGSTFRRLAPRGGVHVDLAPGASVYGSVGSSFRAPALLELGCADPNAACPLPFALGDDPPLAPVRATTYEAGGQWLVGPLLLRGSAYRSDVRDEIFFIASHEGLVSGYFTNIARTRRDGGEFAMQGTLGERMSWYASYARANATFESPVQIFSIRNDGDFAGSALAGENMVTPGNQLPLLPRNQAKGGVAWQFTRAVDAAVDARYTGPQWLRGDEANQTRPLSAYTVVDARAGASRGDWRISATLSNLLDSHAATFGTFNENRQTGALERFLTPLEARAVRITVGHLFGASPDWS